MYTLRKKLIMLYFGYKEKFPPIPDLPDYLTNYHCLLLLGYP